MIDDADVLAGLGATGADLLGSGGEARVYVLGGNRVARIMRPGARLADAMARSHLLAEIAAARGNLPFATSEVESVEQVAGRIVSIEPRLSGEPLSHLLSSVTGSMRRELLQSYFDTAGRLREIQVSREYYGPLIGNPALRGTSWSTFAAARLEQSARTCPVDLRDAVAAQAAVALPEPSRAALVHLDYFPANVLALDGEISAVLDFGPSAVIGDARMDAWSAVAYLDPEITPQATAEDHEQGIAWLAQNGLADGYPAARRWLAAYWSFACDDASLMDWCRRILQPPG